MFCSFYSAEKRAPKKPQRFSSGLPDSQELVEIRTKKKVSDIDWSKSTAKLYNLILHIQSCCPCVSC